MSATANRFRAPARIEVPTAPKMTDAQRRALPLLERVLLEEHIRHADRLAQVRAVATKLPELDFVVRAAAAVGCEVAVPFVREGYSTYGECRARAVVLQPIDSVLTQWRKPKVQNAIADALFAAGWRVVYARADGSVISRDSVVFIKGRRAVETTVMREWVLAAIEAGHITDKTEGDHPARDTGAPLNTTRPAAQVAA